MIYSHCNLFNICFGLAKASNSFHIKPKTLSFDTLTRPSPTKIELLRLDIASTAN